MTESKQTERAVYVPKVGEKVRVTKRRYPEPPGIGEELVVVRARAVANECWCAIQFLGYDETEWHCVVEPSETPAQERPECEVQDSGHIYDRDDCCTLCGNSHKVIAARRAAHAEKKAFEVGQHVGWDNAGGRETGYIVAIGGDNLSRPYECERTSSSLGHVGRAHLAASQLRHETPPASVGTATQNEAGAKPPQPEATSHKLDPYAEHRRHLDRDMALANDAAVAVATDRQNELRHHGWARKQRQALEQLKSPLPAKSRHVVGGVFGKRTEGAPPSWPEDSGEELGHS